jgi:hypothetical protein
MGSRALAWTLVGSCGVAWAFSLWVASLPGVEVLRTRGELNNYYVVGVSAASMACGLTGAALLTARPRNILGWLLILTGISGGTWQVALAAYGGYGTVVARPSWPLASWVTAFDAGFWAAGIFSPSTLLLAFYPDGRLSARWWRWPVGTMAIALALIFLVGPFSPALFHSIAPDQQMPLRLPATLASLADKVGLFLVYGVCAPLTLVIWVATVVRLLRAKPPQGRQLAWLVCVVMPFLFASALRPNQYQGLTIAFALGVPVAVTVGVLRYRLLDIEIILRRGLVYGALTVTIILLYGVVTALAGSALDRRPLPGVLAATLVAVTLAPARDRLQRAADRLVYGPRIVPLDALADLRDHLVAAAGENLLPAALSSVAAAIQASGARIVSARGQVLSTVGAATDFSETVPMRLGGEVVGTLELAQEDRVPGSRTRAERRLRSALAAQLALLVRAADLTGQVEAERDRVVAATGAERDRLRSGLDGGLGPSLAGIDLGLHAASDAMNGGNIEDCARILSRIRAETTSAVTEVRRLLRDLVADSDAS